MLSDSNIIHLYQALAYCHAIGTRLIDPPEPNATNMADCNDPRIHLIAEGNCLHTINIIHLTFLFITLYCYRDEENDTLEG